MYYNSNKSAKYKGRRHRHMEKDSREYSFARSARPAAPVSNARYDKGDYGGGSPLYEREEMKCSDMAMAYDGEPQMMKKAKKAESKEKDKEKREEKKEESDAKSDKKKKEKSVASPSDSLAPSMDVSGLAVLPTGNINNNNNNGPAPDATSTTVASSTQPQEGGGEPASQQNPAEAGPEGGQDSAAIETDGRQQGKDLAKEVVVEENEDYTLIPETLERQMEALDPESYLRPTIITPGDVWRKQAPVSLLGATKTESYLFFDEQKSERDRAMDLIDALSRSGCLAFEHAQMHVMIASTHCFDKALIETVIQENVNPIEKLERSSLILSTTIHNRQTEELVRPEMLSGVLALNPLLIDL